MKKIMAMWMCVSLLTIGAAYAQKMTVVTEEWPPYSYSENDGVGGMATEVVRAALKQANLDAEFSVNAWARSYDMARRDENVLIYNIRRTAQREDLFQWVATTVPATKQQLFKLKKRTDIAVATWDDAKKYTIGVMREDSAHQLLLEHGLEEGKQLFPVTREVQNIRKLFDGKIDLIASFDLTLQIQVKKEGFSPDELEPVFVVFEGDAYAAFSKSTSAEFVARLQKAFEQIKADGTVDAIWKKYMAQE